MASARLLIVKREYFMGYDIVGIHTAATFMAFSKPALFQTSKVHAAVIGDSPLEML